VAPTPPSPLGDGAAVSGAGRSLLLRLGFWAVCQALDEAGRAHALIPSPVQAGVDMSAGASAALGGSRWSVASKRAREREKNKNYSSAWVLVGAILGHVGWVFSEKGTFGVQQVRPSF